jgi:WD40 repeat protein
MPYGPSHRVQSFAFSDNSKWLASGSKVSVKLWEIKSGKLLRTLDGGAQSLAFSPDGSYLVAGSRIWDVKSWKLLHTLEQDSRSLAFSPNGKWLASVSNGTLQLWTLKFIPSKTTVQNPDVPEERKSTPNVTEQTPDLSNTSSWLIKAIVIIVGVILLLSLIWCIIQSFSPSLRPHVPRIMAGIIVGITVGITTTVAAYYLFGSPETATVSGVILAVVAHYFIKEA